MTAVHPALAPAGIRAALTDSLHAALQACDPYALTRTHLPAERPALVIAAGKAALPMLRAAEDAFPGVHGLAVTRYGHGGSALDRARRSVTPDTRPRRGGSRPAGTRAHRRALGGRPRPRADLRWRQRPRRAAGVSLAEKIAVTEELLRSGAPIGRDNTVRRHLSAIKGGRLAAATPARVLALILSDVPGDNPATSPPGPPSQTRPPSPTRWLSLTAYAFAPTLRAPRLARGIAGELPETPKPDDPIFLRVENRLIGSGRHFLDAARTHFEDRLRITAVILSDAFSGEARELAAFHAELVRAIQHHAQPLAPPVVLLSGGEANVTMRGAGTGGRNQEFLLALAHALGDDGAWAIACDTDGIDGTTDAAGAIISPDTLARAADAGLCPATILPATTPTPSSPDSTTSSSPARPGRTSTTTAPWSSARARLLSATPRRLVTHALRRQSVDVGRADLFAGDAAVSRTVSRTQHTSLALSMTEPSEFPTNPMNHAASQVPSKPAGRRSPAAGRFDSFAAPFGSTAGLRRFGDPCGRGRVSRVRAYVSRICPESRGPCSRSPATSSASTAGADRSGTPSPGCPTGARSSAESGRRGPAASAPPPGGSRSGPPRRGSTSCSCRLAAASCQGWWRREPRSRMPRPSGSGGLSTTATASRRRSPTTARRRA